MPLHTFTTAIGCCGIAWEGDLITGFLLPGDTYAGRPESPAHTPTPFTPEAASATPSNGTSCAGHDACDRGASGTDDAADSTAASEIGRVACCNGFRATDNTSDSIHASEVAIPPPFIATLIERVQAHLGGKLEHLRDLPLDWARVTPFQARVLRATVEIPPGQVLTYGELAERLGAAPGTARAIGGALGANPWPLLVPCHRVMGAGGRLTGFSSRGGVELKARLLAIEGYAWA